MNKFSSIWVFSDTPSRLPELMNGAQALGEKVNTFVLSEADCATACHLGADDVWLLSGKPEDRMVEDYADVMAETIRQHSEGGAVLLPNTRRGKTGFSLVGSGLQRRQCSRRAGRKSGGKTYGLRRPGDGGRNNRFTVRRHNAQQWNV